MIDTHAHINIDPLIKDVDNIIKRAKENGVHKIIAIGINKISNQEAIKLANKYPCVYASIGIHPQEVLHEDPQSIIPFLHHPKVVAVGEIGIDLYWQQDNLPRQKEVFIEQLKIAQQYDLPVIIHSRNSADVIYDILKDYPVKGVMHCYSEHVLVLPKFIELGFYMGIGGVLTFKNAKDVLKIAMDTPLDKILLETDAPYLAPVPFRGKINEPKNTRYVLEKLSQLRGIKEEELQRITTDNAYRLFFKLNNEITKE